MCTMNKAEKMKTATAGQENSKKLCMYMNG